MFLKKPLVSYTLLVVLAADLLATTGDLTMTWSSPILPKLETNDTSINPLGESISKDEDAWLVSLINIGAMLGAIPYTYIGEKLGRKIGLLSLAIPHLVSFLIMAFAKNIYLFYFARFFGGLAEGGGYCLLPTYIAEVAEDSNRGMYSVTLGIFWAVGNFMPYAIGPFMSVMHFHIALACFPLVSLIIFSVIGTETPYYLVGRNKIKQAEEVLMKLRSASKEAVQKELKHIQETLKKEEHGKLSDIFSNPALRKAFFISIIFIAMQQLAGFNAITFYLEPIFDASGTSIPSDISSVIIGTVMLLSTLEVPFVVDRWGRKPLASISSFGMAISLILIGYFFYVKEHTDWGTENIFWMPLFGLIMYIVTFEFGMTIIPFTVSSELFPKNVKQISSSAVSISLWVSSFVMTKFFNDMVEVLGTAGTFWFFASQSAICGLFVIIFIPETKGKSFAEIQDMLQGVKSVDS